MLLSNCADCCSEKSRFIKDQETSGLSTGLLGIKSRFERIATSGNNIQRYKVNQIVSKFLLVRDKLLREMNLS